VFFGFVLSCIASFLFLENASRAQLTPGVILITSHPPRNSYPTSRLHELDYALQLNIQLALFEKIVVLQELSSSIALPSKIFSYSKVTKLMPRFITHQPTYSELIDIANTFIGKIVVVTHGDIYFDQSISCLTVNDTLYGKKLLALSRHPCPYCPSGSAGGMDQNGKRFTNNFCERYIGSHDAFIFKSPTDVPLDQLRFTTNRQGAENIAIKAFIDAGYLVDNPCFDEHAFHFHCDPTQRANRVEEHMVHLWNKSVHFSPPSKMEACSARYAFNT
jgi:hypothetical protein